MAITKTINGKQITFDIESIGDGVGLVATHVDGKEQYGGYIVRVQSDGSYAREVSVNSAFGFKTNKLGKIKQDKDF